MRLHRSNPDRKPVRGMFTIFVYLTVIASLSCACGHENRKYDLALEMSGDNRPELEKVIRHYSQHEVDSLKLEAAYFLIENMSGHYTLEGEKISFYRKLIEEDTVNSYYHKKLLNIVLGYFVHDESSYKIEDVKIIKAAYLIRHIDASFELMERSSWLDIIPFDFFLEYVLPYRFADEPFDLWRDSLHVDTDRLYTGKVRDYFTHSCLELSKIIELKETTGLNDNWIKENIGLNLLRDCYTIAYADLFKSRTLGIPCVLCNIPFYSNRNGYHYWVEDPPLLNRTMDIDRDLDRRTAKVFRRMYSRNTIFPVTEKEYIPDFFKDPFNLDVTDVYFYTEDIEVEINKDVTCDNRYAYLCAFNDLQWKPIAIGEVERGSVKFKKMAKNIVYLPVYYSVTGMTALNYPFILNTKGEIEYLIPDANRKQVLRLERKNPILTDILASYYNDLVNTIIEASDFRDFKKTDTVFVLRNSNKLVFAVSNERPQQAYRWYRIRAGGSMRNFAELYFYDSNGESLNGQVDSRYYAITDGDPLTNILLEREESLVIDFRRPVIVSKLFCLPRSDGNGVYPDNTYELLYYDLNHWLPIVSETPGLFLESENAPINALFWLRNLTTGSEERIFTYENGAMRFW